MCFHNRSNRRLWLWDAGPEKDIAYFAKPVAGGPTIEASGWRERLLSHRYRRRVKIRLAPDAHYGFNRTPLLLLLPLAPGRYQVWAYAYRVMSTGPCLSNTVIVDVPQRNPQAVPSVNAGTGDSSKVKWGVGPGPRFSSTRGRSSPSVITPSASSRRRAWS